MRHDQLYGHGQLEVQRRALTEGDLYRHAFEQIVRRVTDERLRELTTAGTGFVYASSLMGVTGTRDAAGTSADALVRRIRATTDLPVCVGIGISDAAQAARTARFADGVIVASVLVKAVLDAPDAAAGTAAVAELTAELGRETRRHAESSW